MTTFHVACGWWCAPDPEPDRPCFRIVPEDEPERWIAQTNEALPPEVQEEAALIMAQAMTRALG